MALTWREELATGVTEIDTQHKELFVRLNSLLEACNAGKGKAEVGSVIAFLEEYVVAHFAAEEKLQRESNYPDYQAHRALHEKFIQDFSELKEQFAANGATVRSVILINRTLVDWLVNHIGKADRQLADHLKGR